MPKRLAVAVGRHAAAAALHGDQRNCIEGNPQRKLRTDDLLKAFGGPSKLTGTTLPGRHAAAAGGAFHDLPEDGLGLHAIGAAGGVPTVRNVLKPLEKNLARCATRGR